MNKREEFIQILEECGYDACKPKTEGDRLAVNLAAIVWNHRQKEINEVKGRIREFKSSLENL